MKLFTTKIKAIDPYDGKLKTYFGPNVEAMTSKGLRSDTLSTDTELDASCNVAINH